MSKLKPFDAERSPIAVLLECCDEQRRRLDQVERRLRRLMLLIAAAVAGFYLGSLFYFWR